MNKLILLFGSACAILNPDFSESWTAEEKDSSIWQMVIDDRGKSTWWWFPIVVLTTPFYNFNMMFEKTDFVQHTWDKLWLQPREKPIHRRGVVQQISWVEEPGQTYTGLFKGGNGIARYSLGTKDSSYTASMLPGMALKFFRTNVTSGGIHSMYSTSPNDSRDFFMHRFSNHIKEGLGAVIAVGGLKFAQVSRFILQVGLKDFAQWTSAGLEDASPSYPFRLSFVPLVNTPSEIPSFWDAGIPEDFTDTLVDVLDSADQHLFNIYAYAQPDSSPILIGKLVSRSGAVKSRFGDAHLMFGHHDFAEDVEENPEWESFVPTFSKWNLLGNYHTKYTEGYSNDKPLVGGGCPYGY